MGFAPNGCRRAVYATAGQGLEAAMNWVLEHMGDADFDTPYVPPTATGTAANVCTHAHIQALRTQRAHTVPTRSDRRLGAAAGERRVGGNDCVDGVQHEPSHQRCAPSLPCSPRGTLRSVDALTQPRSLTNPTALRATGGDIERATDWIFSHADEPEEAAAPPAAAAHAAAAAPAAQETLSDGPSRYRLIAFVSHMGTSTASGHYVAHIRKNGQWVLFNDAKVAVSEDPPKEMGYLYVYARIDVPVV